MEIRSIVVPIDFEAGSTAALSVAKGLAKDLEAKLLLLHVCPLSVAAYPVIVGVNVERVQASALASLKRIEATLKEEGFDAGVVVKRGGAAAEIVGYAAERDADLIVMGTHGRGPIGRAFLGSVAQNVVRIAPCPVVTVRSTES